MKFLESIGFENRVFECTVIKEMIGYDDEKGVLVKIDPPVPRPLVNQNIEEFSAELSSLFGDGNIDQAILFTRWAGENLAPRFDKNPTGVSLFVPKGRCDWNMGEFHCLYWAFVLEDGPITFPEMAEEFERY